MITNPWDAPFEEGCYLLHFESPIGHAEHYSGSAECIADRIDDHEHTLAWPPEPGDDDQTWKVKGRGAKLVGVANHLHIDITIARTWTGLPDLRKFETSLKRYGSVKPLCPICSGAAAYRRMKG